MAVATLDSEVSPDSESEFLFIPTTRTTTTRVNLTSAVCYKLLFAVDLFAEELTAAADKYDMPAISATVKKALFTTSRTILSAHVC